MTDSIDETQLDNEEMVPEEAQGPSEKELLMRRADMLGVRYHPNIGLDKLKAKVQKAMTPKEDGDEDVADESDDTDEEDQSEGNKGNSSGPRAPSLDIKPSPTKGVTRRIVPSNKKRTVEINQRRMEANRLIRVRVNNMNPAKKDWEGELISVGSAKVGTFTKYIPYNVEYHIPKIILDHMLERKCTIFKTVRGRNGEKLRKGRQVNEFAVEFLDPLTKEELKELERRQALMNDGLED